ncbi:hypothetical protein MmiHf6_07920 [Methanimicrococcus hongohii]|uniref:Uncharacterized protein n=1 Tax=Methanimicrococcus hongohii TaxID=3028295 RepID=A0AA96V026_9EURY|nr:hypothetical protein [Methanimicrococcus sp. Hf6]WNY23485.1 hypothetical protein MmiHf6_07920 [Methanimicrococcus sp. Hf6]
MNNNYISPHFRNFSNEADLIKKAEEAVNQTIPGLTMFVRDVNLPDSLAQKYEPGMIIREKAFVDASMRVMGMVTTHRYAILSNHMADFGPYEHGTNWGLCVAARDSRFKVLAVHKYSGKTLILLLHLPDNESWRVFLNAQFSIEEEIILSSIGRFEYKCNLAPIPELAADSWLVRCSFPIGMDDEGNFFEID